MKFDIMWECQQCGDICEGYDYDWIKEIAKVHCYHGCRESQIVYRDIPEFEIATADEEPVPD